MNSTVVPLADLVVDGYRVVYENTEILSEPFDPERHVKYLQAANVSSDFPTLRADQMGWVDRTEWERYVKGRIRHGELLIEVKGKAEKVALVPPDFPTEVLVSGTLYKMILDESRVDTRYVLIYLLSKFGTSFRDRGKSNILVSYVNKDELYAVPIPIASTNFQASIAQDYTRAEEKNRKAQTLYAEAETLLLDALGLNDLDASNALTYEANFRVAAAAGRLDTNYFQPKYNRVRESLSLLPRCRVVPLKDVLSELTNGQTPLHHDLNVGEVPFLTAEHVSDFQLDFASEKRVLTEHHTNLLKKTQLHTDDVLITIKGKVGNAAVVENVPGPVNINQDVGLMRVKPGIPPYYIAGFLNCLAGKLLTEQLSTGQINPFLGLGNLEIVPIPIFEEPEMDRLALLVKNKVGEARQAAQEAQNLLETAKCRVEQLIEDGA